MNILVDKAAIVQLKRIDQVPHRGEMRYYYVADKGAKFHLVSQIGVLELLELPCVVDANIGWSEGWHGKCHPHHEGMKLTKVTLRRVVGGRHRKTLSQIISESRSIPLQRYRTPRWKDKS